MNSRPMEVLSGPSWIYSDLYEIIATSETETPAADRLGPMLQTLLEERFRLKIHIEPRETDVYALTVVEKSPNLHPAKESDCAPIGLLEMLSNPPAPPGLRGPAATARCGDRSVVKDGMAGYDANGITMLEFAGTTLESRVGRPVVDRTGLSGRFSFHLDFALERPSGPAAISGERPPEATEPAGPSIFTALQKQLGLKLSPIKSPLDVIIVDAVQRPSEN